MRRTAVLAATLGVLAAIAGSAAIHTGRAAAPPPVAPAFGKLAYVWRGHLYVADASGRRQITFHGLATDPVWSHDGASLTYQIGSPSSTGQYQTWTIRADGSGAHCIAGSSCTICRSPDGRRLVVIEQGVVRAPGGTGPGTLRVPGIAIADAATGRVIRRYRLPSSRGDLIFFRGWWPDGHALLFQVDIGASASLAADGLKLYSLTLASGKAHLLGIVLTYPDWLALQGTRALIVAGAGRSTYDNKRVAICSETGGCRTIAGGAKTVALDPTWSPAGNAIAWVQSPAHPGLGGPGSDRAYRRWEAARTVWEAESNGAHPLRVQMVGGGIADPQWSRDGRGLLYIKDNAIWYDAHLGVSDPAIIARLFPTGQLPQVGGYWDDLFYYWHIQWESRFAWWQP